MFYDFLFALLHTKPFRKKGLLLKERILSNMGQIHAFKNRRLFKNGENKRDRVFFS